MATRSQRWEYRESLRRAREARERAAAEQPDVRLDFHGSIAFLVPLTPQGTDWIEEHIGQGGYQPRWPTVLVEPRYAADIVQGMVDDGLTVAGI